MYAQCDMMGWDCDDIQDLDSIRLWRCLSSWG